MISIGVERNNIKYCVRINIIKYKQYNSPLLIPKLLFGNETNSLLRYRVTMKTGYTGTVYNSVTFIVYYTQLHIMFYEFGSRDMILNHWNMNP